MRVVCKTCAHCVQTLSRALKGISRRRPSRKQQMATMSASMGGRESAPAAKRTKTVTSEGASGVWRRFMPSWKNDFPWVTVSDGLMRCQYCTEAGKNVFTTTSCDKLKKDALRKHAHTNDHRAAVQAKAGRKDMQRAVATTYRQKELAVCVALRTIYFMAKKHLPNDIFSDLKQLQVLQVSSMLPA